MQVQSTKCPLRQRSEASKVQSFGCFLTKTFNFLLVFFTFNFLLFTFDIPSVFASDTGVGGTGYGGVFNQALISPASPLYFLKSLREVLELKFAGTTEVTIIRHFEFTNRRLREVNSLAGTANQDLIASTLERYWAEWGELKKLVNLQDEIMAGKMSQEIVQQMTELLAVYQRVSEAKAKRPIRSTIYKLSELEQFLTERLNALNKYPHVQQITVSKLSACHFLSREATSSNVNEVERAVFTERAQKCPK